jgi:PPOX class probable F420-dependent enzyme
VALPPATAEDASAQETPDGHFSPLAPAKRVLLATFRWGRTPVASPTRMVVHGDRAYFQTWSKSPAGKRLRTNDWVQVAPCAALGLYRHGPWLDATARLLAGEEASQAAGKLARQHPGQRGGLPSLAYRLRGARPVHYELRPCAGAGARADRGTTGRPREA